MRASVQFRSLPWAPWVSDNYRYPSRFQGSLNPYESSPSRQPIARRKVPADQVSGSGVLSIRDTHFGTAVLLLPSFILIAAPHGRRHLGHRASQDRPDAPRISPPSRHHPANSNVHAIVAFDARLFRADDGNDRAMIVLRILSYLSLFASVPAKFLYAAARRPWLRD